MKNISIPVDVPSDILIALNESEQELKKHFQVAVAMMLFQEGKLTLGACRRIADEARMSKYCSERGAKKEHSHSYVIDEQRSAE